MKTALIVIDVQNDFCPGGALAVNGGDEIIPLINAMWRHYDVRCLTQDWHPEGHSSFASSHEGKAPFDITKMFYGNQVLWPDHCIIGSNGAAFHPNLKTDDANIIVRKGSNPAVDSYSAFFENDHKTPTGLHGYLQTLGVTHIDLAGLATDYCVAYSALDAATLGYKVKVLEAACRAIDLDGSLDKARAEMRAAGITLER